MLTYTCQLRLNADCLPRGPLPNPTHSLLLGEPHAAGQAVGCLLQIVGGGVEIVSGASGEARLDLFDDTELGRSLPSVMPVWYGRIIGEASGIRRV